MGKILDFRPPSDGGLMIPQEAKVRTFVEAILLSFYFFLPFAIGLLPLFKFQLRQFTTGYYGLPPPPHSAHLCPLAAPSSPPAATLKKVK